MGQPVIEWCVSIWLKENNRFFPDVRESVVVEPEEARIICG